VTAATRIVVTEPPGEPTAVALYADGIDEPLASIALGPATCSTPRAGTWADRQIP